jgi:hypothetical protein
MFTCLSQHFRVWYIIRVAQAAPKGVCDRDVLASHEPRHRKEHTFHNLTGLPTERLPLLDLSGIGVLADDHYRRTFH